MQVKNRIKVSNTIRKGVGKSHGTFGEFLQGVLPDNKDFLVTFPVQQFSECEFISIPESEELRIYPSENYKSYQIAIKILDFFNMPIGGMLRLTSSIQQGKGLASSTADMIATSRAIEDCFNLSIPTTLLEDFMRGIEPSDGIMYPGVVVYNQKEVKLQKYLGNCPALTVLALDEKGKIDTIDFNRLQKPFNDTDKLKYQELLDKAILAFEKNDLELLGNVTTQSSILNQKLLLKRTLDDVLKICNKINGLGIVTAHSGTYIGILISNDDPGYTQKIESGLGLMEELGYPVHLFHSV